MNEQLELAAAAIVRGELVVMPTETVYGLAADATSDEAVQRIFAAKGRPSDNPLIVHIARAEDLPLVARDIPDVAWELARRFWPGPLTLVLPKAISVSTFTTAGLETVAVRVPNHPLARELCLRSGRPLAAPSANVFTHLSPTRIEHLSPEIRAASTVILDGGASRVGIESTILSLIGDQPRVLREGQVSRAALEDALGIPVAVGPVDGPRIAPGQYLRHYSPDTPVVLVDKLTPQQPGLCFGTCQNANQLIMSYDPAEYAFELYDALFQLDQRKLESIGIEMPPDSPEWAAIRERLHKAAGR
ncbi:MAG: threonylcarbamoyl-AMP synthase [Chthonomonas sp.]|nr:threonylcarbamoyl-AMP synthase [Chthonomonas sp.]